MNRIIGKRAHIWTGLWFVLLCGLFIGGCGSHGSVVVERAGSGFLTMPEGDSEEGKGTTVETAGMKNADGSSREEDPGDSVNSYGSKADSPAAEVYVYVCGAVREPGVYPVPAGSRIADVVEAAGGLKKNADKRYWNLAERVSDGQMIDVPTEKESGDRRQRAAGGGGSAGTADAGGSAGTADAGDGFGSAGKINLNTADAAELQKLPGIGAARSEKIVAYRESNGGFARPEEILKVSGIGESLYARLKDLITV